MPAKPKNKIVASQRPTTCKDSLQKSSILNSPGEEAEDEDEDEQQLERDDETLKRPAKRMETKERCDKKQRTAKMLEATKSAIEALRASKGHGKGESSASAAATSTQVPKLKASKADSLGATARLKPCRSPGKAKFNRVMEKATSSQSPEQAAGGNGPEKTKTSQGKEKGQAGCEATTESAASAHQSKDDEETQFHRSPPKRPPPRIFVPVDASEAVLELLRSMASVDALQRNVFASGFDIVGKPLSKVSKDMIREGFTWLKAIELELSRRPPSLEALEKLSSSFYKVVPLQESEGQGCISSLELFRKRLRVVTMLSDVEAAHCQWKLLVQAAGAAATDGSNTLTDESLNKLYRRLKCEVISETEGTAAWAVVQEYLQRAQDVPESNNLPLKLKSVFAINRFPEPSRFARFAKNPNRLLLWHGARFSSWLSLLANGPRAAPEEAPNMGYAFGKGLYFFDVARAALNECDANYEGSGQTVFLLLGEVALGNSRRLAAPDSRADRLPQGCQSVLGIGAMAPDPSMHRKLEDGVRVPLGPIRQFGAKAGALPYNQFVVYNSAQVHMRYLVEVELPSAG